MTLSSHNLEPLATYLEPRFGNVYSGELTWTPELRQAVMSYLLNEVAGDAYEAFLCELEWDVPKGTRDEQVAFIIDHHEPWQIAYACHIAAVNAVPTLQQLLEALSDLWAREDWRQDATFWLQAHATYDQLHDVARSLRLLDPIRRWQPYHHTQADYDRDAFLDLTVQLPAALTPPVLLDAWNQVTGPAPTDLTDEEWTLLEPFIPTGPGASKAPVVRQAINGMLWRQAHPGNLPMPARYGAGPNINIRKANYRKWGVFARMLSAVEGNPEAERLVEWLREVLGVEDERWPGNVVRRPPVRDMVRAIPSTPTRAITGVKGADRTPYWR